MHIRDLKFASNYQVKVFHYFGVARGEGGPMQTVTNSDMGGLKIGVRPVTYFLHDH